MKIIGSKAIINGNPESIFNFLIEPKNIEALLPADKISDFQVTENGCSFKVQGGILIPLVYTTKDAYTTIRLNDGGKGPFEYEMVINIAGEGENQSIGNIEFDGKINAFMKMMVERPLTSLFESMTKSLQEQFA